MDSVLWNIISTQPIFWETLNSLRLLRNLDCCSKMTEIDNKMLDMVVKGTMGKLLICREFCEIQLQFEDEDFEQCSPTIRKSFTLESVLAAAAARYDPGIRAIGRGVSKRIADWWMMDLKSEYRVKSRRQALKKACWAEGLYDLDELERGSAWHFTRAGDALFGAMPVGVTMQDIARELAMYKMLEEKTDFVTAVEAIQMHEACWICDFPGIMTDDDVFHGCPVHDLDWILLRYKDFCIYTTDSGWSLSSEGTEFTGWANWCSL